MTHSEHSVNKNERSFNCEMIPSETEHLFLRHFRSLYTNGCSVAPKVDPGPVLQKVVYVSLRAATDPGCPSRPSLLLSRADHRGGRHRAQTFPAQGFSLAEFRETDRSGRSTHPRCLGSAPTAGARYSAHFWYPIRPGSGGTAKFIGRRMVAASRYL